MPEAEEKKVGVSSEKTEIARLLEIVAKLRAPGGCPWDREQTLESLKPCLVEECGEVLDAIDHADMDSLCEELGDLLLQIVFQCDICSESGHFDFEDVAAHITEKLIRRHPHVFGDVSVRDSGEVLKNWAEIKKGEKAEAGSERSAIDGVPRHLPALMRAFKFQKKAAAVGFDWEDERGAMEKLEEELGEFEEAVLEGDEPGMKEEMGDVLFSLVNVARKFGLEPESALQDAVRKFRGRFHALESHLGEEGKKPQDCSLAELDGAWEAAKEKQ